MIDYINKRLNDWARWRLSDRATIRHMLGAKSCWPQMLQDDAEGKMERHGTIVPINDLECCEMDKAVLALPAELQFILEEFYYRTNTTEGVAKRCGISRATLHRRIDQAHQRLLGLLNDQAAGIRIAPGQTLPEKKVLQPVRQTCINSGTLV